MSFKAESLAGRLIGGNWYPGAISRGNAQQ